MSGRNKLADIPGKPLPERQSNLLADLWDEAKGSFARYGRRSGAQRDASLAMLNQAVDRNTDPLTGAGMKALGLAGLVTHPLAFFPTREEWGQRLQAAGNDSRIGRSIGGFLSDLPSLIDPQMAAGGAATVAPAIFAGMMAKTADLNKLKQAEKLAELGHSAEDIHDMTGRFRGADNKWRFEIDDSAATVNRDKVTPEGAKLSEVYNHPEFFAAYPQLAETPVYRSSNGMSFVDRSDGSIHLGDDGDWNQVIPHESQHLVQGVEDFARGGNSMEFNIKDANYGVLTPEVVGKAANLRMLADHYGDWNKAAEQFASFYVGGGKPSQFLEQLAKYYDEPTLRAAENPTSAYYKLAGEVEARNVQNRLGMTGQQRAASFPRSTETGEFGMPISQAEQIIRFDEVGGGKRK